MKEPTSPAAPLAAFPPQPEEYRSRAPEFYGFVAWSSTYLLFVLFILWGFLPDEWIVWSGVTWYPNRCVALSSLPASHLRSSTSEWALLLPAWSMVLVWLTYFTYFALALFATPGFSDISTITGASNSLLALSPSLSRPPDSRGRLLDPDSFDFADAGAATEMHDIPITLVNRALYDRG